jgi:hypothetical protein
MTSTIDSSHKAGGIILKDVVNKALKDMVKFNQLLFWLAV